MTAATTSTPCAYHRTRIGRPPVRMALRPLAVALLLGIAGYAALFVAPTETTMGLIQRIFYFHVPSRLVRLRRFLHLFRRQHRLSAHAHAEVGLAGGVLRGSRRGVRHRGAGHRTDLGASGVGHLVDLGRAADLYVCALGAVRLLICCCARLIDEPERRAVVSAVFGIFAAFDIPLVYFSIWFFRTQHPQPVIGDGGSLDPRMVARAAALLGGELGVLVLLLRQRYRLEALRWEVDQVRVESGRGGESA